MIGEPDHGVALLRRAIQREGSMKQHSKTAWAIASRYSAVLASETRDLAYAIDKAIADETERLRTALKPFADAAGRFSPYPEENPWYGYVAEFPFTIGQIRDAARAYSIEPLPATAKTFNPHDAGFSLQGELLASEAPPDLQGRAFD